MTDAVQYGPANTTFGWEGPDPNTKWGGYRQWPPTGGTLLGSPPGRHRVLRYTPKRFRGADDIPELAGERQMVAFVPAFGHRCVGVPDQPLRGVRPASGTRDAANPGWPADGLPENRGRGQLTSCHMTALDPAYVILRDQKLRLEGDVWA